MRHASTRDGGLDVHHESRAGADGAQAPEADVIDLGTSGPRHADRDPRGRTRHANAPPLVVVDAAGPCGAWRSRALPTPGPGCWVVAPARRPTQAGDRVTTDRRDAGPRARLRRSGALTPVEVPAVEDDASRDLRRARADASGALQAATCRLNAGVLRPASHSMGRAPWGPAPLRWRADVVGATPAPPLVFPAYVRAVHEPTARLQRVAQARRAPGNAWRRPAVVAALEGRRGGHAPWP